MGYNVEINAAPKQLQEMMQMVIEKKVDTAKELKPIAPGVLPTKDGEQDYKMQLSGPGTWTHPTLPEGKADLLNIQIGTMFWDKDEEAWALTNVVDLPVAPVDGTVAQGDERAVSGSEVFNKALTKDAVLTGVGVNNYDKSRNVAGKIIRTQTGLIEDDLTGVISDFFTSKEGDVFLRSGITIPPLNIAFYDALDKPLKPLTLDGAPFATYNVWDSTPFKAPAGAVKGAMNVAFNGVDNSNTIMLVRGTEVHPYQPYKVTLGEEWLPESITGLKGQVNTINNSVNTLGSTVSHTENKANEAISTSGTALSKADQSLDQAKNYTDTKVFGTSNINNGAVTTDKLSQAVKDLIAASGSGIINNNPDEEDLVSVANQLKFKDGADGFARIRVRGNVTDQINEIVTKASTFGSILIKNVIDFGSTTANRVTLTIPNGTVVKFVGQGRLKNVRLVGNFYIEASDKRIFENVEMFHRGGFTLSSDLTKIVIPSNNASKWWDRINNTIVDGSVAGEVDYFTTKPLHAEIGTPVLEAGQWKVVVGGNTWIKKFDTDSEGYVLLFKSDRYVFTNKDTGAPLTQGTYYNPANLRVRRISPLNSLTPYCKILNDYYKLEWWGASTFNEDNTDFINIAFEAISSMTGVVSLTAGAVYNSRGGVIARSFIRIIANNAKLRLKNSASQDLLIYDTSILTLIRFDAETLILDGNKTNQLLELNGISFGFPYNESKNVQINNTTMWGYSWDEACLVKLTAENFTGKAIYCAVPGDVTAINCRGQFSKYGWYNDWEHFKLIESHGWSNEVGLYSSGNHFRIIGGSYAHNSKHNIELFGCQEFQIISPSAIDSNEDSVKITNCDRFVINGLRALNSKKYGLRITNSSNGLVSGCMVFDNTMGNYSQSGNTNVVVSETYGIESTQKGGSVTVINSALNLGSSKTYFNLINAGVTSGTFKFAVGEVPTGGPAGITSPFLMEVTVSVSNVYSQRYFVELTSLGDSGKKWFRDFIYNSQTDADTTTSIVWREI